MQQIWNPYLPLNEYIADGEPHVFGNRVYVFGSHDRENGATFCMDDYVVWSAPLDDLTSWSNTGVVYRASQDPAYDPSGAHDLIYMFAPDVVQGNDGRYYLYYCLGGMQGEGGYSGHVSVAVSDRPDGQYSYLGFVKDTDGNPLDRYVCFDPAVINDGGTIRLYYGTYYEKIDMLPSALRVRAEAKLFGRTEEQIRRAEGNAAGIHPGIRGGKRDRKGDSGAAHEKRGSIMGAVHVELSDDMLTAKSEPVRISEDEFRRSGHAFFEASSIRKVCFSASGDAMEATRVGGDSGRTLYYFVYSSKYNHELCYATSPYPDHDFRFGGVIVSNGDIGYNGRKPAKRLNHTGNNHGGIEQIDGKWYVFYHRQTNQSNYSRQECAEPIEIRPDGTIDQVEITSCGLNIDPLDGGSEQAVTYPAAICCNLTNGRMRHAENRCRPYPAPKITNRFLAKSYEQDVRELAEIGTEPLYGDVTADPSGEAVERFIGQITDGTIIGYKYFFFEKGTATITVRLRGTCEGELYVCTTVDGSAKDVIEVHQSTEWKRYSVSWEQDAGAAPLFLCYAGKGEMELLDFTLG